MQKKRKRDDFPYFIVAVCVAILLWGCATSGGLTKSDAARGRSSIDAYLSDKQAGAPFRANFYDSVANWNAIDTSLTGHLSKEILSLRPEDSAGAHAPSFYGFEQAIMDAQLSEIYSVSK